jgi:hypothetical protein
MPLTNPQKAILHVAKADRKLSDAEYRAVLVHLAGVTSSTELDRAGFEAVMGFFEYLGFAPLRKSGPDYGTRPGMASFAQLEFIRSLWVEWSGAGESDGLTTWLARTFKVSSLRFLTAPDAAKAITALKAMKAHKRKSA